MGASNSTRRVVVESEDGTSVIQVSDAAAARLRARIQPPSAVAGAAVMSDAIQAKELPSPDAPRDPSNLHGQALEDHYLNQLKLLEDRNARLFESTKKQFSDTVVEVENKFLKYSGSPVCQDLQDKVLTCYQTYPSEALRCSDLVASFTACVDLARKNTVLSQNG